MNVQRLREVLTRLRVQLEVSRADERLVAIENALQAQVSNPTQPQFQSAAAQSIDDLRAALREAQNEPSTTLWHEALSEIGLQRLIPSAIFEKARSIVDGAGMFPGVALDQIRDLRRDLNESKTRISQTIDLLTWMGFTDVAIPTGKAEIGILIPRKAVDNNLDEFGDEAQDLNNLLNAISLAVTGEPEDIQIDSVSSSEFSFFLWLNPVTVKAFAWAVRELIAVYKDWIEVQDLRDDHRFKKTLRKKTLEAIEHDMQLRIDKQITKLTGEIMKTSPVQDEPTKNDLTNRLSSSLRDILKRYTEGYLFDARASKDAESSDDAETSKTAKSINEISQAIERLNIPSENLLELPPAPNDGEQDDEAPGNGEVLA